ncbi:hypothetical protein BA895_01265 [Humibacillus sp. DSM 29435]|nr:hypothetical protein BA895_01265 [Humibacillus sp. DSM 29435]
MAAALLAGAGTAWFTRPAASANPADGFASQASTTVTTLPPDDPALPTPPVGSSGAPNRSTASSSGRPAKAGVPLLGRSLPPVSEPSKLPAPTSFSIARLGITMKVRAEGVAGDGQMALAPPPADIGWYRYGPRPGDPAGATVLAGHLDEPDYGIGPLVQLTNLRQGDVITVASGKKAYRYSVKSVTSIKKTALDLSSLFTREGPPQLHVVTCGGNFDQETRHYDANVVVIANPIG